MEFIYEIEEALPKEICEQMIERFKKDDRKGPSSTIGGVNLDIRKSTVLNFSQLNEWKDVDNVIFKVVSKALDEYNEYLSNYASGNVHFGEMKDEGYFIQEFRSGEFYKWHVDDRAGDSITRNFTILLYLNTLEEDQGGCTEFWCGKKVQPKQGKILIFPSCWTYIHRGAPVKNGGVKYVCGTWAV
jgi:hypothetical protein|tara:strand:+ start:137 stop:694 length:558 start_codon:yes stop_codon:yes gene_type:complete